MNISAFFELPLILLWDTELAHIIVSYSQKYHCIGFILKKHLTNVWRDAHMKRKQQEAKLKWLLDLEPAEERKPLGFL